MFSFMRATLIDRVGLFVKDRKWLIENELAVRESGTEFKFKSTRDHVPISFAGDSFLGLFFVLVLFRFFCRPLGFAVLAAATLLCLPLFSLVLVVFCLLVRRFVLVVSGFFADFILLSFLLDGLLLIVFALYR